MSAALEAELSGARGELEIDVALAFEGTAALVGPNGAGKSSVLGMLLGAVPVTRGRVVVRGDLLLDTARGLARTIEARRLGWVPQGLALFPHLEVREQLVFAARAARGRALEPADHARLDALLARLDLTRLAAARPGALSGGERQRVALARALAIEPRALLLDEPLAALDAQVRAEVRSFLRETLRELALPTLLVTHDLADAEALASTTFVLEAGRVAQRGTIEELRRAPASAFVRALVRPSG